MILDIKKSLEIKIKHKISHIFRENVLHTFKGGYKQK